MVSQVLQAWVWQDYLTVALFMAALVAVCLLSNISSNSSCNGAPDSVSSYFNAGQGVPWWAVAASLFGTNVGTEQFVGLAGWGCKGGIAVSLFEIAGIISLSILAFCFLPVYLKNDIQTLPEFLERRYSPSIRAAMVAFLLCTYILTKVGATLYATVLITEQVTNLSYYSSFIFVVAVTIITIIYTFYGGLASVIYTDVLQSGVLISGGFLLLLFGWIKVKSFNGIIFWNNDDIAKQTPEFFHLLNSPSGDSDIPWTGFLCGYFILGFRYWCCDQVIVQRVLASRDISHGRIACAVAGILKILPLFIIVLPGMIARFLMMQSGVTDSEGHGFGSAEFNDVQVCDKAYPFLLDVLFSNTGLTGLMFSAILSAAMSSLSSVFNSAATIFTLDVYCKVYPSSTERDLVYVGRVIVIVVGVLSIGWLAVIPLFKASLFHYVQEISSYQAPAVLTLYALGICWAPANTSGAIATLIIGSLLGLIKFIVVILVKLDFISGHMVVQFANFNFLYFAMINFAVCIFTHVLVSLRKPCSASRLQENTSMLWERNMFTNILRRQRAVECLRSDDVEMLSFQSQTSILEKKARDYDWSNSERRSWILSNFICMASIVVGLGVFLSFM